MTTAKPNVIAGRNAFLEVLRSEGITHLFGNPGTTELPIMHALKDVPEISFVMAMQESLVVAMADGYSRSSGRLVAANVHVAPGLGNAMGALYNAKFTGTPLILTAGQQEQGHGLMEPVLYDDLVAMARPLVKWAIEVTRLEDLPRILRRAAKIAMTPPMGPVFISLPGDILNAEAGIDLGKPTRIDAATRPSDAALEKLAARVLAAERPVIIAGDELVKSDALAVAALFAETLGAPAYQQSIAFGSHFLSAHPCYMGTLARVQKDTRAILEPFDLVIALGTDPVRMSVYAPIEAMPAGKAIVQIGLVDHDIGKNFPVEVAIKADVRETLSALLPVLKKQGGAALAARAQASVAEIAKRGWSAKRTALRATIAKSAGKTPIDPDFATMTLVDAMPANGILFDEALTTVRYIGALREHTHRFGYHALASGGIGWALPASVGACFANPGTPVVCFTGDGSAMYSIQALWTAAHHKLPLTVVVANNGGYRIIKQRLLAFHGSRNFIGMDFKDPQVDFCALAGSLGVTAERVTHPGKLADVFDRAFKSGGTRLVEVVVDGSV
jgi:benzoylformate decarboxylase